MRPRLNAIPSRSASNAASSAVTRIALGSKRAGNVRDARKVGQASHYPQRVGQIADLRKGEDSAGARLSVDPEKRSEPVTSA